MSAFHVMSGLALGPRAQVLMLQSAAAARRGLALAAAASLALMPAFNFARADGVLPSGGTVVSGNASIGQSGTGMTVTQSSDRAIINWDAFSVGVNNSVVFAQPGVGAALLNRVTGDTPSTIAGQVSANGQIYFVNPNGFALTPTGAVKVGGGFVASSLDIDNADFLSGKLKFAGHGASAPVSNAGQITTGAGGFVALVGGSVANGGTILAPVGKVGLGSGEQATLDLSGDQFLQVALPTAAATADGQALVDVSGKVQAPGGRVELKAATAAQALRDAVNVSGEVSASSLHRDGGAIVLDGGEGGQVSVSGRVSASSAAGKGGVVKLHGQSVKLAGGSTLKASGSTGGGSVAVAARSIAAAGQIEAKAKTQGQGGSIALAADTSAGELRLDSASLDVSAAAGPAGDVTLTGWHIGLFNHSLVTAAGASGGGSIRIGGDWQGSGALPHASAVVLDSTSSLDASATLLGDGGKVVLWSDDYTGFYGTITARGGATAGNGGAVETSSHKVLNVRGQADTGATAGARGHWLLDPADIEITPDGTASMEDGNSYYWSGQAGRISGATISAALLNGDVTISTVDANDPGNGDIFINDNIDYHSSNNQVLSIVALGSIYGSGNIGSADGSLSLLLSQSGDGVYSGNFSGAGDFFKDGPGTLTLTGSFTHTGATVIAAGLMKVGGPGQDVELGQNSYLEIATGAALDVNGSAHFTVGSISSGASTTILNSASNTTSQLIVGGNAQQTSFAGNILGGSAAQAAGGGDISLKKVGSNSLTLSGDNSYGGGTDVAEGTLVLGSATALVEAAVVDVAQGAILDLGATSQVHVGALTGTGWVRNAVNYTTTLQIGEDGQDAVFGGDIQSSLIAQRGKIRVEKVGTNTQVFSSGNGYEGGTVLTGGVLRADATLALGGAGEIGFNGGTLMFGSADSNLTDYSSRFSTQDRQDFRINTGGQTIIFNTALSGDNSNIIKLGTGTLVLGKSFNSLNGNVAISGGTLQLSPSLGFANLTRTGKVTIESGAYLDLHGNLVVATGGLAGAGSVENLGDSASLLQVNLGSGSVEFSGNILGSGQAIGLDKTGGGTWILSGQNSFGQSFLVENGIVQVGADALGGTGNIGLKGGTLQYASGNSTDYSGRFSSVTGQVFSIDTNGQNVTFGSALNGSGNGLKKLGAGTLTLAASNSYTGGTTLTGGTLEVGGNALNGGGAITFGGGTLKYASGNTTDYSGRFTVNKGQAYAIDTNGQDIAFGTALDGPNNGLEKLGAGTLTLTASNGYTGDTVLSGGALEVGANALNGGGAIIFNGGTLKYASGNTTDYSSRFTANNGQAYAIDTNGQDIAFGTALNGSGNGLDKLGLGTLSLTASNGYTGVTTLTGGTLEVGAGALNSDSTIFFNGGTLKYASGNTTDYSGQFALVDHQDFRIDTGAQNVTFNTALYGDNSNVTKLGSGTLLMKQQFTSSNGSVQISAGTLKLPGTGGRFRLTNHGALIIDTGATLDINSTRWLDTGRLSGGGDIVSSGAGNGMVVANDYGVNAVFSGSFGLIGGSVGLQKYGAGTLALSGNNADMGDMFIYGGTVTLGSGTSVGTGRNITFYNNAVLDLNGVTAINVAGLTGLGHIVNSANQLSQINFITPKSGGDGTFSAAINDSTGNIAVAMNSPNMLTVSSDNIIGGGISLNSGTVRVSQGDGLGGGSPIIFNGGTLLYANAVTSDYSGRFAVASGQALKIGVSDSPVTFGHALALGGVTLIKSGTGGLILAGDGSELGALNITGGTVKLGGPAVLPTLNQLTLASQSVLDLNGVAAFSVGTLQGSGQIVNGGNTRSLLKVGARGIDSTYQGIISSVGGDIALEKDGTGALTLTGANSFGGGTTIASGSLKLALGGNWTATNTLTIADGASLDLNGAPSFSVNVINGTGSVINSDTSDTATLRFDVASEETSTFAGTISDTGRNIALEKAGGGTLILTGDNAYGGDTHVYDGVLQVGTGGGTGALGYGNVIADGRLTVDRSGPDPISLSSLMGSITGTGTVIVTTLGDLVVDKPITLSGTYSGIDLRSYGSVDIEAALTQEATDGYSLIQICAGLADGAGEGATHNVAFGAGGAVILADSETFTLAAGQMTAAEIAAIDAKVTGAAGGRYKIYGKSTAELGDYNTLGVRNYGLRAVATYSLSGITAQDRDYNGGTDASLDFSQASITGSYGDTLALDSRTTGSFASKDVGGNQTVSITVQPKFTADGWVISGYQGMEVQYSTTASILPKRLTLTALAQTKDYDRGTAVGSVELGTGYSADGLVDGEGLSSIGLRYDSAAAGAGNKTIIIDGAQADGNTKLDNYDVHYVNATDATISPLHLSVTGAMAQSRAYDGRTDASVSGGTLVGMLQGDDVTLSGIGAFASKDVGTGVAVSLSLDGAEAGNYVLDQPTGLTADITKASLTLTALAQAKFYDGQTSVNNITLGTGYTALGMAEGEGLSYISLTYDSAAAGTGNKTIFIGGAAGDENTNLDNYDIAYVNATGGTIKQIRLSLSGAVAQNKSYDGTTDAVISGGVLSGRIVFGEDISFTGIGTFASKDTGSGIVVTPKLSGSTASNYFIQQSSVMTASIGKQSLTLTALAQTKDYDRGTAVGSTALGTGYTASGFAPGEGLSGISLAYDSASAGVGTKTIIIGGAQAEGNTNLNNYNVTYVNATGATISPLHLSVTGAVAQSRAYNGGTDVSVLGGTLLGALQGDDVTLAQSGSFASKNVGTGLAVTVTNTLSGAAAGNYVLDQTTGLTADITKAGLTLTAVSQSKDYDGTTSVNSKALGSGYTAIGFAAGEGLQDITLAYASPNASRARAIAISGALGDAHTDLGNYNITYVGASGLIAALQVRLTALPQTKAYDGNTAVPNTALNVGYVASGFLPGQGLSSVAIAFAAPDVKDNLAINVLPNTAVAAAGTLLSNYVLNYSPTLAGSITPAALTLTALAQSKDYDGASDVLNKGLNTGYAAGGFAPGEGLSDITLRYDSASAGEGSKTISINGAVQKVGTKLTNYNITYVPVSGASINRATLTLTALAQTKDYDRSTAVGSTALGTGYTALGFASGEGLSGISLAYGSASAGVGTKTIVISNAVAGAQTSLVNYNIRYVNATDATVMPLGLTVTGSVAQNKQYDGTRDASVSGGTLVGALDGDEVLLSQSGTFASKAVGTGIAVAVTDSLSGSAAGNYVLQQPTGVTADITAARLTVTGTTVADKPYDGTATATISGGTLHGVIGDDVVLLTQSGSFASADVGEGIDVTVQNALSGADSGNYVVALPHVTGRITTAQLILTALAQSKDYDGTTAVPSKALGTGYSASGFIVGEGLSNIDLAYDTAEVGTGKTISIANARASATTKLSNYLITYRAAVGGEIKTRSVTVSVASYLDLDSVKTPAPQNSDTGLPSFLNASGSGAGESGGGAASIQTVSAKASGARIRTFLKGKGPCVSKDGTRTCDGAAGAAQ